jgi:hypothetical protein
LNMYIFVNMGDFLVTKDIWEDWQDKRAK